jgi:hypothetical protein
VEPVCSHEVRGIVRAPVSWGKAGSPAALQGPSQTHHSFQPSPKLLNAPAEYHVPRQRILEKQKVSCTVFFADGFADFFHLTLQSLPLGGRATHRDPGLSTL